MSMKILLPELETVTLKDRKTKETYDIELFVPIEAATIILDNWNDIISVLPGTQQPISAAKKEMGKNAKDLVKKKGKTALNLLYDILHIIAKYSHEQLTRDWIIKNISLKEATVIIMAVYSDIVEYLKITGVVKVGKAEAIH